MTFVSKLEAHPTNTTDAAACEPGTVAIATVRGVNGVRVMVTDSGTWITSRQVGGFIAHGADRLADVRPLVVLDVDANDIGVLADAWANLEKAMKDGHSLPIIIEHLRDQIEAQTKPPRIPEPGLWGVVEAGIDGSTERYHYVRRGTDGCWYTLRGAQRRWNELLDPTLIREGINA